MYRISDVTSPPDPTPLPVNKNPPAFETVVESDSYLSDDTVPSLPPPMPPLNQLPFYTGGNSDMELVTSSYSDSSQTSESGKYTYMYTWLQAHYHLYFSAQISVHIGPTNTVQVPML